MIGGLRGARFFVWLLGPLAAWGAYAAWGAPHLLWSYSYHGGESGFASRWFTRCAYVGPFAPVTIDPTDGRCPLLVFRKAEAGGDQ